MAIDRLKASNPEVDLVVVPPTGPNLKDFEGKHAKHLSYIEDQPVIESEAALTIETGKDESGNAIRYTIFLYNTKKGGLPTEDQWKTTSDAGEETPDRKGKNNVIDGEPISAIKQKTFHPVAWMRSSAS